MNKGIQPKRRIRIRTFDGRTVLPNGKPMRRNFTKKKLLQVLKATKVENYQKEMEWLWNGGWQTAVIRLPKRQKA